MRLDDPNSDIMWTCTRKKAYSTDTAERVARRINEERGGDVVAYGCTHCGRYHVGRRPPGG